MSERKSGRHKRTRRQVRADKARAKFAPDDPLRYLHTPWSQRANADPPVETDEIDYQAVRDNPGEVVTEDLSAMDEGTWG